MAHMLYAVSSPVGGCKSSLCSLFAGVAGWVPAPLGAIDPETALSGMPSRATLTIVLSSLHMVVKIVTQ